MKKPLSYPVWNRYVIQHCGNSAANNVLNTVRYAHSDAPQRCCSAPVSTALGIQVTHEK